MIVAGGIESGATQSISRILEVVGLASYPIPPAKRPVLLYAGNQQMAQKVKAQFEPMQTVRIAPEPAPILRPGRSRPAYLPGSKSLRKFMPGKSVASPT